MKTKTIQMEAQKPKQQTLSLIQYWHNEFDRYLMYLVLARLEKYLNQISKKLIGLRNRNHFFSFSNFPVFLL